MRAGFFSYSNLCNKTSVMQRQKQLTWQQHIHHFLKRLWGQCVNTICLFFLFFFSCSFISAKKKDLNVFILQLRPQLHTDRQIAVTKDSKYVLSLLAVTVSNSLRLRFMGVIYKTQINVGYNLFERGIRHVLLIQGVL